MMAPTYPNGTRAVGQPIRHLSVNSQRASSIWRVVHDDGSSEPTERLDRLGSAAATADFLGAVAKHARWQVLIETVSTLTGDLSASL
jgi:hypothetical protein